MGTPTPGPGKFSQRTDKAVSEANRSLPNADYGEQAQYQEQQQGAKMAQSAGAASAPSFADMFGDPSQHVTPLDAESTQPNTPVTDGAALGAGAGTEVLNTPNQQNEDLQGMLPYMPVLEFMANQPGASWAMRNVVRKAKSLQ